jgi:hypothetical protein
MSGNGFLKLVRSEKALELFKYPNCFTLLSIIAYRASRNGNGLERRPGEALIGDYENYGLSEQQYRTSKERLNNWKLATFKATNKGTVATLTDNSIYDINQKPNNEQNNITATDEQRTSNEQVTTNKKDKNIKNERIKELTAACVDFLKCFPKKTKQRDAGKIFKSMQLTGTELEKLMAAVKVLASQAADGKFAGDKDRLQYCPNPATWLEEKQWENKQEQYAKPQNNPLGTGPTTEENCDRILREVGILKDGKPPESLPQEPADICSVCRNPDVVFCVSDKKLCGECKAAYDLIPRQQKHRASLKIVSKQYLPKGQFEDLVLEYKAKTGERKAILR